MGDTRTFVWSDKEQQQFSLKLLILDGNTNSIYALFAGGLCALPGLRVLLCFPQGPGLRLLVQNLMRVLRAFVQVTRSTEPPPCRENPLHQLLTQHKAWNRSRIKRCEGAQGKSLSWEFLVRAAV